MALHDEVLPKPAPPSKSTCLSQRQVLGSPVSLFGSQGNPGLTLDFGLLWMPPWRFLRFCSQWCTDSAFINFILYLSIAYEQRCDSFKWTAEGLSHIYVCTRSAPNSPPIQAVDNTEQSSLRYAVGLRWLSDRSRAVCTCWSQSP